MDFFRDSFRKVHFRRRFSAKDDEKLKRLVKKHGFGNWNVISQHMNGRNARQVHERYVNYLSPDLNKDPWTKEEEELLLAKRDEIGNQWKKISAFFKNRTDIALKSRYHQLIKKMKKNEEIMENENHNDDDSSNSFSQGIKIGEISKIKHEYDNDDQFFCDAASFLGNIDMVFNEKTFQGVYDECIWN